MKKRSASTREDPVNIYVDYQSNARDQGEGPSRIPGNIPVNPYQEAASKLGLNYNYEKSKFPPMAPPGLTKNPNGIRPPPFVFQPHRSARLQRIFEADTDKSKGVARDLTSLCEYEASEEPKVRNYSVSETMSSTLHEDIGSYPTNSCTTFSGCLWPSETTVFPVRFYCSTLSGQTISAITRSRVDPSSRKSSVTS